MRTDRTSLCTDCAVRFPAADRCPRCEGTAVFDLSRASARRKALRTLKKGVDRFSPERLSVGELLTTIYVKYGILLLTLVAAWFGYRLGGTIVAAFLYGVLALWGAVAAFFVLAGVFYALSLIVRLLWLILGSVLRLLRPPRARVIPRILAIDDQELLPETGGSEVRGHVRARETIPSPLGHAACVAFRVVGEGPLGEVDDAGGTSFDVVMDDGRTVLVELGDASIALEVDASPRTVRPDAKLRAYLDERGIFPERGPVRLAEALLHDGEAVVVVGARAAIEEADGYRGSKSIAVMKERAGTPLVIRRPGSPATLPPPPPSPD